MATRPTGNPPIWSSIALYPAGADPWSNNNRSVTIPTGEAGGFTPDTGIVAEYANAEFKVLSTWVEWLSFGSNAAGLDAHVVETDPTGVSAIAGLTAGGTAGAFPAITATANAGATGSVISATNNSGGFAILANSNGVLAAIRGVSTGVQPGIEGRNTGGGGPGISGTGNGAGSGVVGTGGATGDGGTFTGGATSGAGVSGTAPGAGDGILGACTDSTFAGVHGTGSATNPGTYGVFGEATQASGLGVLGSNPFASANPETSVHSGVLGVGLDGTGIFGATTNGYGVWAQSSTASPVRAALHLEPQDADPTTPLDGDIYPSSVTGLLGFHRGTQWRRVHDSRFGFVHGGVDGFSGAQNSATFNTAAPLASISLGAPNDPKFIGAVELEFTAAIRNITATQALAIFQWYDDTASVFIDAEQKFYMGETNAAVVALDADAYEMTVSVRVRYTIPTTGARIFKLLERTNAAGVDGLEWDHGMVTIRGVY